MEKLGNGGHEFPPLKEIALENILENSGIATTMKKTIDRSMGELITTIAAATIINSPSNFSIHHKIKAMKIIEDIVNSGPLPYTSDT